MEEGEKGIDHLIYGAPDLDRGMDEIERRLGVRPARGGRHPQYGTRNALLALGEETYLEVMAPDPELPVPEKGTLFSLDELEEPRLVAWALRCEEIEAVAGRARAEGVGLGRVEAGSREQPDGTTVSWRLTDPRAVPLDGAVPFLIAWGETPHPARSAPDGGELVGLEIRHPDPGGVRDALRVLGVEMPVAAGPGARLAAAIRTGERRLELG